MADQQLRVSETAIPGFYEVDLVVHGDDRGWFKEAYQKEKLKTLGLPDFQIIQNNMSFNAESGVTRGLHAEPWEKFITVATGKVLGAWVDLRNGPSFGQCLQIELDESKAVFVPRGVANGYQTLTPNTVYSYLVNEHWSAGVPYVAVHPYDPALALQWVFTQDTAILSEKDKNNPLLSDINPMEV